ncbi:MAG TPA: VWA domain-containing protein [Thermoanaerobaculia bacterium]|nr:VWA domain-containing protein [Thermoanaerobaculia bacterium]
MKASASLLLLAGAALAAGPARAQDARGPVRETAEVSLVEVPVRVADRDGKPIRGLSAGDFTLQADGRPQEIVGFDAIDLAESTLEPGAFPSAARRRFLFLFDLSFSRPRSIVGARRAAADFVTRRLGAEDLAAVATFSVEGGFRLLVTFSSDRAQLARAIETLGVDSRHEPADPLAFGFEPKALARTAMERGAEASRTENSAKAMVDALETMTSMQRTQSDEYSRGRVRAMIASFGELAHALDSVEGRKDVVLLSEGFQSRLLVGATDTTEEQNFVVNGQIWKVDGDRRFGSEPLRNEISDMTSLFRRSDCVIHSVDVAGLRLDLEVETDVRDQREPHLPGGDRDSLFEFAEETGGEYFRNSNDLSAALEKLLVDTSVVYVLAFKPERPAQEGRFHEIKVRVGAKGARVTARPGYFDRSVFRRRTALERSLAAADAIATERPVRQIPIRMLAVPFAVAGGPASVPVQIEIPGAELLDGVEGDKTGLEVYVYAHGPENRLGDFLTQSVGLDVARSGDALRRGGIRFSGSLRLAPGAWRLRAFVRNSDTGRAGLVAATLRVPDFEERKPELLPPIFLDAAPDWIPLTARPRGDVAGQAASFPAWSVAGENVAPAALAAVPERGELLLCLVSYHLAAESPESALRLAGQVLDADGKPLGAGALSVVSRSAPDAAGGRATLLRFEPPRELPPGRYGLRVFAEDAETGERRQAVAAFRVP